MNRSDPIPPRPDATGAESIKADCSEEAFDALALSRLQDLSDEKGSVALQIITIFEREWPARLAAIDTSLEAGTPKDAAREAHSIASTCGVLGGRGARQQALALERAIAAEDRSATVSLRATLHQALENLSAELRSRNAPKPG